MYLGGFFSLLKGDYIRKTQFHGSHIKPGQSPLLTIILINDILAIFKYFAQALKQVILDTS